MVELRTFTRAGDERLIRWIDSHRTLVQWAGTQQFTFPLTPDQLDRYRALALGAHPSAMIYEAFDVESGAVIGHCELGAINREQGTASICRVFVDPAVRGKGMCLPMIRSVLEIGFKEIGLRRIDLRVFALNIPAIRCYERAGLVREGVQRQAARVGSELWDVVLMSILRGEWHGNTL